MFYIFLFHFCYAQNKIIDSQQINTTEPILPLNLTLTEQMLNSEYKLILTLVRLTEETQSQLIICDTNQFEKNQLPFSSECIRDQESYLTNQTQIITLNQFETPIEIRKLYNIYTVTQKEPYIWIVSTGKINNISIILQEVNPNICLKPCQNNGVCVKGYCECQVSFIGTDCGIQLLDISNQLSLLPFQNYYYHIKSLDEDSYLNHLNNQVNLSIGCIHDYSTISETNFINLDQYLIQNCYKKTINLEQQLPIQLHSYIIISQLSNQQIEIISDTNKLEKLIFIIIPIVIFLLITIIFVRKNRKNSKIIKFVPVIKFAQALDMLDSTAKDNDCVLCKKEITQNQSVRLTYCNHIFHDYCFKTWWTNNKNCPLCKSSLDLETLKKNQKSEIIQQSTFSNMQSYRKKNLITFVDTGSRQIKFESQIN